MRASAAASAAASSAAGGAEPWTVAGAAAGVAVAASGMCVWPGCMCEVCGRTAANAGV